MEDLPHHLILDILSRLDTPSLARTRLVSKTLNCLSRQVTSVSLHWTVPKYLSHLHSPRGLNLTPFKSALKAIVLSTPRVQRVAYGMDCSIGPEGFGDYDEAEDGDDMYMTDDGFVGDWVWRVRDDLRVLKVADFWVQSCWRKSEILPLLSWSCHNLCELELKSTWLSVEGLVPIPSLTSLTLDFVRLDDENLNSISTCFPSLQVLNLCGVGGLQEPKIELAHLKICQCSVSNVPQSLEIIAPNLVRLKLQCQKPKCLILETPMLSEFDFSIVQPDHFEVKSLVNLRSLRIESPLLGNVVSCFSTCKNVEKLVLDARSREDDGEALDVSLETLFESFPNLGSLTVGPRAWSVYMSSYEAGGSEGNIKLDCPKQLTACIPLSEVDKALQVIASVLNKYNSLSDMTILVHLRVDLSQLNELMSTCTAQWPSVRWKCGMYKEVGTGSATSDAWEVAWKKQVFRGTTVTLLVNDAQHPN
ncbi:hypothetical protein MLD38_006576 [Melastoma candidum]|uniref:Uncharacterized protein n=1 Tax=Melastoma candidum TaxID=119954 RepID=A0ACB9RPD4_9MYRT|nr:hypothetical protein MLD38_006576 [Melastoma candidum]